MFGINSSRVFMKLAHECYIEVAYLTILDDPETWEASGLIGFLQDGDLEILKDQCPELFGLAGFYYESMSQEVAVSEYVTAKKLASSDAMGFIREHLNLIEQIKLSIYSWLAFSEQKRIKSLAGKLSQIYGGSMQLQMARELDQRVRRLEMAWVKKADLFRQ